MVFKNRSDYYLLNDKLNFWLIHRIALEGPCHPFVSMLQFNYVKKFAYNKQ